VCEWYPDAMETIRFQADSCNSLWALHRANRNPGLFCQEGQKHVPPWAWAAQPHGPPLCSEKKTPAAHAWRAGPSCTGGGKKTSVVSCAGRGSQAFAA